MARIISGSAPARCFLAARTVQQAGSVERIGVLRDYSRIEPYKGLYKFILAGQS